MQGPEVRTKVNFKGRNREKWAVDGGERKRNEARERRVNDGGDGKRERE